MPKHFYLCGFMGVGKTTVGKASSVAVGRPFYDTDDLVVSACGMSIPDIFSTYGEPYFRKQESHALMTVATRASAVIATGGGLVINPDNVAIIKQSGTLFYLDTPFSVCYERIQDDQNRPNANARTQQQLRELYDQRLPIYRSVADYILTGDQTPAQLAKFFATFESEHK